MDTGTLREVRRSVDQLLANPRLESVAREVFRAHDGNNDGRLDVGELKQVLEVMSDEFGSAMPSCKDAEHLLRVFVSEKSGDSMRFEEFFELFLASLRRAAFDRSVLLGRDFFVNKNSGQVWEVYEKLRKLGHGSFGTAYLSRSRATQEERVVKSVKKSRARIPVEDIEREIIIMRQLDHPHVVRLFEWYEDSHRIYLVMDALKGGTLRDAVGGLQKLRRAPREDWVRRVVRQVADAMVYCHSLHLVHKDLKDENVMLLKRDPNYEEPFAIVIDLGIAEMFSPADQGHEIGGTPATMAPEVWTGKFGPKCDVWSLGCVLFELLAGEMPFVAATQDARVWQRLHRQGPNWGVVRTSTPSRNLCQAMLSRQESQRPGMAQCLKHEWFRPERGAIRAVLAERGSPLQVLAEGSALQRALLLEIAAQLPLEKAERIVELFETFDRDDDGHVTLQEFKRSLARIGFRDEVLLERAFTLLDADQDGRLSFSEFAAMGLLFFRDLVEERLTSLFMGHDSNRDGVLEEDEVEALFKNAERLLGAKAKGGSTEDEQTGQAGRKNLTIQEFKEFVIGPAQIAE